MKNKTTHKASAPVFQVNENVSLEGMHFPARLASAVAATFVQFVCTLLLIVGLFTRINTALLTCVLGVAILQNLLAGRDPQLAILYTLVVATLASMGGGRFSLDARPESRYGQTTSYP